MTTARANPYFTALQVNYKGRSEPDAAAQAAGQADEILLKFRASTAPACGITYSANSNQTAALNTYYAAPNPTNWAAVQASFNGAGNQGAVMNALLGKLTLAEQTKFRILPVTTMMAAGGPTTPEMLKADLTNVSDFINNSGGQVFGWQNEDNNAAKPNHFAIGGGIAATHGFTSGSPGSKYVENYFDALQTSSAANQPTPAVPEPPAKLPGNAKEAEEKAKREDQEAQTKLIEQLCANWQKENRGRSWRDVANPRDLPDPKNAVLIGIDTVKKKNFGYWAPKDVTSVAKKLATVRYFEDPKSGQRSVSICKKDPNYQDYGNGRDFLQSEGASKMEYDYPEMKDVDRTVTLKFLLDSIYQNAESFDNRGNPRAGKNLDFKKTPAGIQLGGVMHQYISAHIGDLNSRNPYKKYVAQQCQKMLELETLSLQLAEQQKRVLAAAASPSDPGATASTVAVPSSGTAAPVVPAPSTTVPPTVAAPSTVSPAAPSATVAPPSPPVTPVTPSVAITSPPVAAAQQAHIVPEPVKYQGDAVLPDGSSPVDQLHATARELGEGVKMMTENATESSLIAELETVVDNSPPDVSAKLEEIVTEYQEGIRTGVNKEERTQEAQEKFAELKNHVSEESKIFLEQNVQSKIDDLAKVEADAPSRDHGLHNQ